MSKEQVTNPSARPANNEMFLHNLWNRSQEAKKHRELVAKAKREGKPRPPIPHAVRAKFVIDRNQMNAPIAETFMKMEPKTDTNGDPIRNERGEVQFKKAKPVMSMTGMCDAMKASYKPNQLVH